MIHKQRVASTFIKTFIPNFEEVFGKQHEVLIIVEALNPPTVNIRESVSTAGVEFQLRILNPLNEDFDVVYMKGNVHAEH